MSKYFKLPKGKEVIEVIDLNTVNVYVRAGFIEVDKAGKPIKQEEKEE